jgi:hypothetical protein
MGKINSPHIRARWLPRPKRLLGPALPLRAHDGGHSLVRVRIAAFTEAAFTEAAFTETVKPSQALPISDPTALVDRIFGCNWDEPIVVAGRRMMP